MGGYDNPNRKDAAPRGGFFSLYFLKNEKSQVKNRMPLRGFFLVDDAPKPAGKAGTAPAKAPGTAPADFSCYHLQGAGASSVFLFTVFLICKEITAPPAEGGGGGAEISNT
jgi:hypothetical protein